MTANTGRDPGRRNVNYTAPVGSIALAAFDADGEPYEIRPCPDCLPWYAEVVHDPQTGEILVREWHAVQCSQFESLLADD